MENAQFRKVMEAFGSMAMGIWAGTAGLTAMLARADTRPIINKVVLDHTEINSEKWVYWSKSTWWHQIVYTKQWITKRKHFVVPTTGAHSQSEECNWRHSNVACLSLGLCLSNWITSWKHLCACGNNKQKI